MLRERAVRKAEQKQSRKPQELISGVYERFPIDSAKLLTPNNPNNKALKFRSPIHLLKVLSPGFVPYEWQIDTLLRAAGYTNGTLTGPYVEPTPDKPFKLCLPAANGSGKDMVVIAAFAVWAALFFPMTQVVITTASWQQMKSQTEPHIVSLTKRINSTLGKFFRSTQFNHVCTENGSQIVLRVTDEPGRIEGWHPWDGGKLIIIINEAKSIDDTIFDALDSCTGFSWWLEVSSPGPKTGRFYRSSLDAVGYPNPCVPGQYYKRHITAFDCPHIPRAHIEHMKKTKPDWWFQYSILAEYFSLADDFVVTEDMWLECLRGLPPAIGTEYGVGLDLAAGGDKTVLYIRRGNRLFHRYELNEANIILQAGMIDARLRMLGIPQFSTESQKVFFRADGGGVGHGTLDALELKGWKFERCHNQSAADQSDLYKNFGAEVYFTVRTLLQQKAIIPVAAGIPIEALLRQLTSRKYETDLSGRARLEDKKLHRQRTQESPDDSDAFCLCFSTLHPGSTIAAIGRTQVEAPARMSIEEFGRQLAWGRLDNNYVLQRGLYVNGTSQHLSI